MNSVSYQPIESTGIVSIDLPASKSISNRALILKALFDWKFKNQSIQLSKLSTADDTLLMQKVLNSNLTEFNLKNAGTCLRFLTAYFALITKKEVVLTGSERLKNRPISALVDALRNMGASITYLEKEGFVPIQIQASKLIHDRVLKVDSSKSSQFLSSILLIAPFLENKITIEIDSNAPSFSYVKMTLNILKSFGVSWQIEGQKLTIMPVQHLQSLHFVVEADWSSAAFFYGYQAMNSNVQIFLNGLSENSIQGDGVLSEMTRDMGVKSEFLEQGVLLGFNKDLKKNTLDWDFSQCPDLAPVLTMAAIQCVDEAKFSGLALLDYKESQRLQLLTGYLSALGLQCKASNDTLYFKGNHTLPSNFKANTADDHRMLMCLTLLSFGLKSVYLNELSSIEKSFPDFWKQVSKLGFFYKD
jgi:3-phosphoshikimate 1-carboxyvinyltransferase